MQYVQLFEQFIFENKGPREFGCAIIFFDFPEMKELQKEIDKNDLYEEEDDDSYGLEKEPHCTALYGTWKSVKPEKVKEIMRSEKIGKLKLTKVSAFENEKFDVLKFDVKCSILHKLNKKLRELPHTNKHKDFKPHVTIAYLKPGTAKKYIKMFKNKHFELLPSKGVYSEANGNKISFKLNLE